MSFKIKAINKSKDDAIFILLFQNSHPHLISKKKEEEDSTLILFWDLSFIKEYAKLTFNLDVWYVFL